MLKKNKTDHITFIKHSKVGKVVVLIVYVDDIILARDDIVKIESLKKSLALKF